MVLRALSATARACSIWVACRWWAMYCSQSKELLGEPSSKRSKAAESWGRRLGSISWASRSTRAFSAAFFSCSSSWRVFFWGWQTRKKLSVEFDGRKCLDTEKETDRSCTWCILTLLLLSWSSPSLKSASSAADAGFRELSPTSQEKPAATCSLDGPTELCITCWETQGGIYFRGSG